MADSRRPMDIPVPPGYTLGGTEDNEIAYLLAPDGGIFEVQIAWLIKYGGNFEVILSALSAGGAIIQTGGSTIKYH